MALRAALPVVLALFLLLSALPMVPSGAQDTGFEFPSSFDQRDLGIVTPPKNQGEENNCWAFSTVAAAETALLTYLGKTYEETGLDFSDLHAAFFGNNHIDEGTSIEQSGEGMYNTSDDPNAFSLGGYEEMAIQLFVTGGGPVYESDYPYKNREGITNLDKIEDREWLYAKIEESFIYYYGKTMKEAIEEGGQEERSMIFHDLQSSYGFPETVDEFNFTVQDILDVSYLYNLDRFTASNLYCEDGDWTLDRDERDRTVGYTLCDWNRIPDTKVKDDDGKWAGLNLESMAAVKSELMSGHGVFTAYYFESLDDSMLFTWDNLSANHSSQITGWDDDIPAETFSYTDEEGVVHHPEGNGAWIVKNSFGSETYGYEINGVTYYSKVGVLDDDGKHSGYCLLSYYDRSVTGFSSLTMTDRIAGDLGFQLYCHDFNLNLMNYKWKSDSEMRTANMFKGKSEDPLTYISIYTCSDNSTVRVQIYMDPTEGEPDTGSLVFDRVLSYRFPGAHAIELDRPLKMYEGRLFSIVVEELNEEHYYVFSPSVMDDESNNTGGIYAVAVVNKGESFLYVDGAWRDWSEAMGDYTDNYPECVFDNFWMKAYAAQYSERGNEPLYDALLILIVAGALVSFIAVRRR